MLAKKQKILNHIFETAFIERYSTIILADNLERSIAIFGEIVTAVALLSPYCDHQRRRKIIGIAHHIHRAIPSKTSLIERLYTSHRMLPLIQERLFSLLTSKFFFFGSGLEHRQ